MADSLPSWEHGVTVPAPLGLEDDWFDLGSGVLFRWAGDGAGHKVGIIEAHHNVDGDWCAGDVLFDVPELPASIRAEGRPLWQVQSLDPLTLTPSVLCTTCQHHGWITDGRWHD